MNFRYFPEYSKLRLLVRKVTEIPPELVATQEALPPTATARGASAKGHGKRRPAESLRRYEFGFGWAGVVGVE
jgi:hypothetical protein